MSLQIKVLGKGDSMMQKNECEPLPYTIHTNKHKMGDIPKRET